MRPTEGSGCSIAALNPRRSKTLEVPPPERNDGRGEMQVTSTTPVEDSGRATLPAWISRHSISSPRAGTSRRRGFWPSPVVKPNFHVPSPSSNAMCNTARHGLQWFVRVADVFKLLEKVCGSNQLGA